MAVPPEEALSTFEIHPDFQIELVAHEPAIMDPVDLEFDAQGRMFVIEFPGYPFPERPGDIILLEDNDDDGVYETRKVWASGFPVATSIMPYEGGLLIASPPDILYLKDTDGDDKADHREVVLTGFAVDNQQHNISGLTLGLDNWIYIQNGGNSGKVYFPEDSDNTVSMRYDDLRFSWSTDKSKPRKVERYGRSTGGFEFAQDNYGRWFGTHNTQHIQQTVFPGKYLEGIPAPRHASLANISNHEENGLARIYPIGKQETRVNHPEQSGYFSGACGITFYNGGAFGPSRGMPGGDGFNDAIFVCDVVLNLIHVDVLRTDGSPAMTAHRHEDLKTSDFLTSTDRAFRPVNMTVGPDGALYILDMHRDVIEHPEWIPDEIEETLDVNAGKDKGRIFRVMKKDVPHTPVGFDIDLDAATNAELAAYLRHSNGWYRHTAQRLLIERKASDATPLLEEMLTNTNGVEPGGLVQALWTLHHLGTLTDELLMRNFSSNNHVVQENALWIAELHNDSQAVKDALLNLDLDSMSVRSRMILALVAGNTFEKRVNPEVTRQLRDNPEELLEARLRSRFTLQDKPEYTKFHELMIDIARRDIEDEWTRLALAVAVGEVPFELTKAIGNWDHPGRIDAEADLFRQLHRIIGRNSEIDVVAGVILSNQQRFANKPGLLRAGYEGLIEGLEGSQIPTSATYSNAPLKKGITDLIQWQDMTMKRYGWKLATLFEVEVDPTHRAQLKQSAAAAQNADIPVDMRVAHLRLTAYDAPENRVPLLFSLISPLQPTPVQEAAIAQLAGIRNQNVAEQLITRWDTIGPKIRRAASNILLYQRDNHPLLLTALENGDLTLGEMNFHLERRRTLLHSRDPEIVVRAEKLFTDAGVVTRKEALDSMRPALAMQGDVSRGHQTFTKLCAQCHTVGTEGTDLAPNLTEIYRKSAETLLHDIVDPNAGADLEYITYNVETNNGDFHSGIVIADDATGVTLRDAEGQYFVPRADIKEFFTNGLSLMPEELEVGMDPQEMADLLAFLQEPK